MKILILNALLHTPQQHVIPQMASIKDCMIYSFAMGFVRLGHDVTLVAASEYRPTAEETYPFPVIFIPSACKRIFPPTLLPFQPGLLRLLMKEKNACDLIISSQVFMFPTLFAALVCPRKTVVWQEFTAHQRKWRYIPSKLWYNTVARLFIDRTRCIIPRSQDAFRFTSRYLRRMSPEIVDHGVNIDKFTPSDVKKRQFICVAQLIPRKNIGGIIDIFHRFVRIKGYEDVKLCIAGRGELYDELVQQIGTLRLTGSVCMLGFLEHEALSQYLRESCALLVNTRQDLNMVSIPEAIVSGTPVVTNLVPASATYIRENGLGIARKTWDADDLMEIVDNNASYVQRCMAYREKLTNIYTAEKMIEISKNAYLCHP